MPLQREIMSTTTLTSAILHSNITDSSGVSTSRCNGLLQLPALCSNDSNGAETSIRRQLFQNQHLDVGVNNAGVLLDAGSSFRAFRRKFPDFMHHLLRIISLGQNAVTHRENNLQSTVCQPLAMLRLSATACKSKFLLAAGEVDIACT